jgi:hypothetical protein
MLVKKGVFVYTPSTKSVFQDFSTNQTPINIETEIEKCFWQHFIRSIEFWTTGLKKLIRFVVFENRWFVSPVFLTIYRHRSGLQVFKEGCQRNPPGRSPMRIQVAAPCDGQDSFLCSRLQPSSASDSEMFWTSWNLKHLKVGVGCRGGCLGRHMWLRLGSAWMGRSGGLRWHSFLHGILFHVQLLLSKKYKQNISSSSFTKFQNNSLSH